MLIHSSDRHKNESAANFMIISSCFLFTDLHSLNKLPRWDISVFLISSMGSYSIFDGELVSGHIKPVLIITDLTKDERVGLLI